MTRMKWTQLHARRGRGFTMTELLIVVALIVLMIAMAVPTFNFITGSRSIEGTQNQISAYMARARTEAIGLQEIRGVFFYVDVRTDRITMAMVRETGRPTVQNGLVPQVEIFLDLVPDAESIVLPAGVELQVIDDAVINTAVSPPRRLDDGYIGFNTANRGVRGSYQPSDDTVTPFGGVMLFDPAGRLVTRTYGFRTSVGISATSMGDLLFRPSGTLVPKDHVGAIPDVVPAYQPLGPPGRPPRSGVGLALFEREPFENRPRDPANADFAPRLDPEVSATASSLYGSTQDYSEAQEERWIDENAVVLLINRYNGTLVKAQ